VYWWDCWSLDEDMMQRAVTTALQVLADGDGDETILVVMHQDQDGAHFEGADCWCQPCAFKQPFAAAA
jgi:hypothetical protein